MSTRSKWLDWKPDSTETPILQKTAKYEPTKTTETTPIFEKAPRMEPTKTPKMVSVVFVASPLGTFQKIEAEPQPLPHRGESDTSGECTAVPEPPGSDWGGRELDLISSVQDDTARGDVIAFKNILGGTLSMAGPPGSFVSADQYQKNMLDGIFARSRKLQAKQYAGLTLAEREDLASQAEATEKAELRASRDEQRRMQRGWAAWQRWRDVNPIAADRNRAQHADQTGDKNWLLSRGLSGTGCSKRASKEKLMKRYSEAHQMVITRRDYSAERVIYGRDRTL